MKIEYIIDLPTTDPIIGQSANVPNNTLLFFEGLGEVTNKVTEAEGGSYGNLSWNDLQALIIRTGIRSWGVKTVPGVGAAYFANFNNDSNIVEFLQQPEVNPEAPPKPPIITDYQKYQLYASGDLFLGARVKMYAEFIGVGGKLSWQNSTGEGGLPDGLIFGNNGGSLYVVGAGSDDGDVIIESMGGNLFDTQVYMTEDRGFTTNGPPTPPTTKSVLPIPADWVEPSHQYFKIDILDDAGEVHASANYGRCAIILSQLEAIVLYEQQAPNSTYSTFELPGGVTVSGYVESVIPSVASDYGMYKAVSLGSSADRPTTCYIMQGRYAIGNLSTGGNFASLEFVGNNTTAHTMFYIDADINLSNDSKIINHGVKDTAMIYCGGDFSCDTSARLQCYLVAFNGNIDIRNGDGTTTIEGSLYGQNITLGTDVVLGTRSE